MTVVERSEVRFGLTTIPYAIRRSSRRATVSIAIDLREGVLVTAPTSTPVQRLDGVIHAKGRWIIERLSGQNGLVWPFSEHEFVSGETFLYLGRQYRLRVVRAPDEPGLVRLDRGWLVVGMQDHLEAAERACVVREGLVRWYREHAAERLPERVATWARKLGVPEPRVLIRDQRRRWGSCHPAGVVRINWRIVQAPSRLVDYVVAHELTHVLHSHHTSNFWAALGRLMRDYDGRRTALRAIGPSLVW